MAHDISVFVKDIQALADKWDRVVLGVKLEAANLVHRQMVINIDTLLRTTPRAKGRLRNSVQIRTAFNQEVSVTAGGDGVPYATLQEEGGVIRPKTKRWLTIPVHDLTYSKLARRFNDLYFVKLNEDRALLKFKSGDTAYVLAKRVKIEGVGYASKAVDTVSNDPSTKRKLEDLIQRSIS